MVAMAVLLAAGCVSEPEPAPEPVTAAAVAATEDKKPDAIAGYRQAPIESTPIAPMPEPAAPQARREVSIPTDITVLSPLAPVRGDPAPLPEPGIPPAPRTPVTAPASKPVTAVPSPAVKPAPPAAAKAPSPAAPKPAAVPKPAAASKAPAAAVPAEETKPAPEAFAPSVILPATPTSSARSVDAATPSPVAETRLETARGARFELRFPGTGWIYLGDEEGKEGIRYETRRYEDNAAVFAMNPESTGEYLLRFQRQNPVSRATEVSLVRVQVMETDALSGAAPTPASKAASGSSKPAAPSTAPTAVIASPSPVASPVPATATTPTPAATAPSATPSASSSQPVVPPVLPSDMPSDPAALLTLARNELDGKRIQSAIAVLDRYQSLFPHGNDEVLFLYALAYEQDTPFKNVRKAYEYYKRVRDEYPRSLRWRQAADRMAYLERHFFGLR
jgi:hypothetical protein